MKIDSRGRVRFTHNHVRYEINRDGLLRTYRRNGNTERRINPPLWHAEIDGTKLQEAVDTYRQAVV